MSRNGGVLVRAGHTEASVDISRLSKLGSAAVICEVMNQGGRMARLKDLRHFSKKHKLKIASIEDLISFRLKNEKLIKNVNLRNINYKKQKYDLMIYKNLVDQSLSFVIKKGKFSKNKSIRVRVMSKIMNDNNFDIKDRKIEKSLKYLSKYNDFALIIIKDKKSLKQKIFEETKNNNILRYYGIGAQIIKDLNIKNMILVSRSKKKIIGLDGFNIKIIKQEIIK